ncbi:MAG: hypothetical protein WAZ77_15125 [Candidatus Nitrosopolaris sp.]|jgi:hypothetical protein
MRNQWRIGNALMIASGIGITVVGYVSGVFSVSYGGLAIAALGVVSIFWTPH